MGGELAEFQGPFLLGIGALPLGDFQFPGAGPLFPFRAIFGLPPRGFFPIGRFFPLIGQGNNKPPRGGNGPPIEGFPHRLRTWRPNKVIILASQWVPLELGLSLPRGNLGPLGKTKLHLLFLNKGIPRGPQFGGEGGKKGEPRAPQIGGCRRGPKIQQGARQFMNRADAIMKLCFPAYYIKLGSAGRKKIFSFHRRDLFVGAAEPIPGKNPFYHTLLGRAHWGKKSPPEFILGRN